MYTLLSHTGFEAMNRGQRYDDDASLGTAVFLLWMQIDYFRVVRQIEQPDGSVIEVTCVMCHPGALHTVAQRLNRDLERALLTFMLAT
jgi:hypothetical protein